jgi:hypothetical protein
MKIEERLETIRVQKAALAADTEKQQAMLDVEAAFLGTLPAELDIVGTLHANDTWQVTAAGNLQQILEMLPPCNARMTSDGGCWTATVEHQPLDWSQYVLGIYATKFGVHWFHKTLSGEILRVSAHKATLPVPEGYELEEGRLTTVLKRKLTPLPAMTRSPGDIWSETWDAFIKQERYTPTQRMFATAMRPVSMRNQEITMDMLPQAVPEPDTMRIGDAELVILRSGRGHYKEEPVREGSPFVAFPRMGSFWTRFTLAEASHLVAFLNANRCNMAEVEASALQAGLESAKSAVMEFQEKYLGCLANDLVSEVLTRFVQEKTGYPVVVAQADNMRNYPEQADLRLQLWAGSAVVTVDLPAAKDPKGFDFFNPSFYEYVPNKQRLFDDAAALA